MVDLKRIILLTLLFISFTTSVFATCNLDQSRWKWLFSTDQCGFYYDRNTATIKSASTFEVWLCLYYPGNTTSCGLGPCIKARVNNSEHYHYIRNEFNTQRYSGTYKGMLIRNYKGDTVYSDTLPLHRQRSETIYPDSLGENVMLIIKQDLYNYRR